jgi:putative ABC transport system permease protein
MLIQRFFFNFLIGTEALLNNRFRALLTSLGIIFGVAAVIAMLAIGNGAEKEILEQIKQVGSNNIIIKAKVKEEKEEGEAKQDNQKTERQKFSPGLTLADAENIATTIPAVRFLSPEIEKDAVFFANGKKLSGRLLGVNNFYFETNNLNIVQGKNFTSIQLEYADAVCVIGKAVQNQLFAGQEAIGKPIKCGNVWLTVVGVLENRNVAGEATKKLSIRNVNNEVYVPVNTMLLRYINRANVTIADIKRANEGGGDDDDESGSTDKPKSKKNYHQIDRLVVSVQESGMIEPTVEALSKLLKRRHFDVDDYEIVVPELLLKQEQRTKQLFNIVLAIIAGISLLVGGIGIMNIMLASVLERIKEIGLRLSLGARKSDIVLQFMSEAVTISLSGGLLGIVLGVSASYIIEFVAKITTIISPLSVLVSFIVSVSVGLIFGIYPARKAAEQNPIESLRYE